MALLPFRARFASVQSPLVATWGMSRTLCLSSSSSAYLVAASKHLA